MLGDPSAAPSAGPTDDRVRFVTPCCTVDTDSYGYSACPLVRSGHRAKFAQEIADIEGGVKLVSGRFALNHGLEESHPP
jgi:hypothetical protein